MFGSIKNYFNKRNLRDQNYAYLFDSYHGDEYVCFDCETTGLDVQNAEILSIGAIKIKGNRLLYSDRLELIVKPTKKISEDSIKIHHLREIDVKNGLEINDAIKGLIEYIGNRPLVGYYLEFDVAMVNKALKEWLGITLPNAQHEVSAIYYDKKVEPIPQGHIDLRFDTIMEDLKLPSLGKHSAINDAMMTALMFVKLQNIQHLRKGA